MTQTGGSGGRTGTDDPAVGTNSGTAVLDIASFDLAEKSFKTVLEADIHIDNKANRILAAIAFLTAAAAQIFNKAYSGSAPPAPTPGTASEVRTFLHDLAPALARPLEIARDNAPLVAFVGYVVCVLVGASLYLAALGPSLKRFARPDPKASVTSLLFFDDIGKVTSDTWVRHWDQPADALKRELLDHYIHEIHPIARKTRDKLFWMGIGSRLFKVAFVFLAVLVASLTIASERGFWCATFVGVGGLLASFGLETHQRYPASDANHPKGHWWTKLWFGLALVFAILAAIELVAILA